MLRALSWSSSSSSWSSGYITSPGIDPGKKKKRKEKKRKEKKRKEKKRKSCVRLQSERPPNHKSPWGSNPGGKKKKCVRLQSERPPNHKSPRGLNPAGAGSSVAIYPMRSERPEHPVGVRVLSPDRPLMGVVGRWVCPTEPSRTDAACTLPAANRPVRFPVIQIQSIGGRAIYGFSQSRFFRNRQKIGWIFRTRARECA